MDTAQKLGIAVRGLRRAKGINQEDFARLAHIDRKYMSDIENGKRTIGLEIIERIALGFSMKISDLFIEVEKIKDPE